jgi:hypothetical protein
LDAASELDLQDLVNHLQSFLIKKQQNLDETKFYLDISDKALK